MYGLIGQQRVRVEGVLVARRDAPGQHALALVLAQLIVGVRESESSCAPRRDSGETRPGRWADNRSDRRCVWLLPYVVEGGELGRIQKAAAAHAIDRQKVADFRAAEAERRRCRRRCRRIRSWRRHCRKRCRAPRPERVVICATRLVLSPNSASRRSGDDLHALNRAGGKLGGEDLALLIADGLPVDHEADLRVIAQRMKEAVPIGGHAAGAVGDRLAQAARRDRPRGAS